LMIRSGVQFHWQNPGYVSFNDFLNGMSRDKRKRIQQERRKVRDAGVTFRRLTGTAITEKDWDFFHRCYANTYHQHHSSPYLNRDFFARIGHSMSGQTLLIIAEKDGMPVAAALNFFGGGTLYGRYWGATEFISGLHFETCYYQTIEFCIEQKIAVFEGGAQGEHKLARGFLPVPTFSAHWLARPEFATAVARYLERETKGIDSYLSELSERQPFKLKP
ncbi:MAG: GNAT family N-acetyltransferase, partial [Candidatus Nitrotoga sp.]